MAGSKESQPTMLIALVLGLSILALAVAWGLRGYVLRQDNGTPEMRKISDAIQEGAEAFLRRQYRTIGLLSIALGVLIYVLYAFFRKPHPDEPAAATLALTTTLSFLFGALCSGIAGIVGMYVAVRSNIRSASAARSSLNKALQIALRGGAVSGLFVVAMSLFGVGLLYTILEAMHFDPTKIPLMIVGYGFGASFVALFAQLGGGIYTKAADVGADLVGKVEAGIPEDDPRNAAVVADLVGDNVGDCAGRGADLFESMSAENIGAMILGVAIYKVTGDLQWVVFPLVLRSFGIFATIAGLTSVPLFAREDGRQDPMTPLNYGYYIVSALSVIGLFIATIVMLGHEWYWFFFCGLIGIGTGIAFVYITQYYTSGSWRPVQDIAEASRTGPATNIITGTAVGMETTAATAIAIGIALVASFALGSRADIPGVGGFTTGVFGTAVATMGMLMSAAYILSMDTFGPITDNAGGITVYSGAPESARHITDALDSVGNTTKALTKGFAVASAGLAAFLLFSAYLDKIKERLDIPLNEGLPIDISNVDVFVGALIGGMLVFLFSSLAIRAVSSAAQDIIQEVRRQFREDPGIMAGTSRPDYGRAVDITARAALRNMIAPGILAVGTPIAVGLIFRYVRAADYNGLQDASGWLAVSGLLMIGTITGILLATFFNNVGGAWDNAKKYIEAGNLKTESANPGAVEVLGKGTEAHKAAVVGDTVGDPFKDTAGPSLHVLIKLLSTITLVMAPLFIP